jgi:hypothetical protein
MKKSPICSVWALQKTLLGGPNKDFYNMSFFLLYQSWDNWGQSLILTDRQTVMKYWQHLLGYVIFFLPSCLFCWQGDNKCLKFAKLTNTSFKDGTNLVCFKLSKICCEIGQKGLFGKVQNWKWKVIWSSF